jgi:cellobiose phosphorylase
MRKIIYEHGWDGEWFLRAYDSYSRKLAHQKMMKGKYLLKAKAGAFWAELD